VEYGAVVWDPFLKTDIDKFEKVQRKSARLITGDYRSRDAGCVTRRLGDLDMPTLQQRRRELRLVSIYKVVEGLDPAIPSFKHILPIRDKRRIQVSTRFCDYDEINIVKEHQTNNFSCYQTIGTSPTNI
jgi:hypothetical protein